MKPAPVKADFSTVLSPVDVTARQDTSSPPASLPSTGGAWPPAVTSMMTASLRPAAVKASAVHLHLGATAVAEAMAGVSRASPAWRTSPTSAVRPRPSPPPPSSRRPPASLRMNPRETMRVAQGLYENGFITYMRTDSTVPSGQAVAAARSQVAEPLRGRVRPRAPPSTPESKGAQEAHEAIRPAGDHFRTPAQVSGEPDRFPVPPLRASSGSGPWPPRWPTPSARPPP